MKKSILLLAMLCICGGLAAKPKQPQQVTITYKDGTVCTGMVLKGTFVEGPMKIKFFDGSKIEGEFGESVINGEMYFYPPRSNEIYTGHFAIYNDRTKFSPKRSKIKWNVNADLKKVEIQSGDYTITGQWQSPDLLSITAITPESRVDSITFDYAIQTRLQIKTDPKSHKSNMYLSRSIYSEITDALNSQYVQKVVCFDNGDKYEGWLYSPNPVAAQGKGTYTYKQGGKIIGSFYRNFVPLSGTITYKNGETEPFDELWPSLKFFQINELLFTKRESLDNISRLNESERLRIEEEKRQREEQKRLRIAALKKQQELRLAAQQRQKELEEQRKAQEEAATQEREKQEYIRKYGTRWGELVAQKKLTIGMTKQMCAEIVKKEFYSISQYGSAVEVWTYDPQKARNTMASKGGIFGYAILEGFGVMDLVDYASYTFLTFTNGKLTAFSE